MTYHDGTTDGCATRGLFVFCLVAFEGVGSLHSAGIAS
jgi:hypothetical protein